MMEKALPLLEQTVEKQKLTLGQDHENTLSSMGILAVLYEHSGQLNKSVLLNELIVEKYKAMYGPDHFSTLASISNLAGSYENSGRTDLSLPLFVTVHGSV